MHESSGFFVWVDGPNGVGKSTLVKAVHDLLIQEGFKVHLTKELTDTPLGKFIRHRHKQYRGKTLAFLLAADRQNHIEKDILPALQKFDIVISDRYIGSSYASDQLRQYFD